MLYIWSMCLSLLSSWDETAQVAALSFLEDLSSFAQLLPHGYGYVNSALSLIVSAGLDSFLFLGTFLGRCINKCIFLYGTCLGRIYVFAT